MGVPLTVPGLDGLTALFMTTTAMPSPALSHTDGLIHSRSRIMRDRGAHADTIRAIDDDIATGVSPDMTDDGGDVNEWPKTCQKVLGADILVLTGPIWLGGYSSALKRVFERLYLSSSRENDADFAPGQHTPEYR